MVPKFWYVLHSHPKKEEALYQYAVTHGIQCYFPLLRVYPKNSKHQNLYLIFQVIYFSMLKVLLYIIQFTVVLLVFNRNCILWWEPAVVPDNIIRILEKFLSMLSKEK